MEEKHAIIEKLEEILKTVENIKADTFDDETVSFIRELINRTYALKCQIEDIYQAINNFNNRCRETKACDPVCVPKAPRY